MRSSSLPAARLLHAKVWADHGGEPNVRYYQCGHGLWHWTRSEYNPYMKAAA